MMKQLTEKYKNQISDGLDDLWGVWRSLGIFSEGNIFPLSPEEALIGLCIMGRYDQRLFDEALSAAMALNGLLSKSRLINLAAYLDPEARRVLNLLEDMINRKSCSQDAKPVPTPFFLSMDQDLVFSGRKTDPLFEARGWIRNVFKPSGNIRPLKFIAAHNPWIKAKLTFGNSARVDVVLSLLKQDQLTAPDISRSSGYAQKGIWNILTDLDYAGWVKGEGFKNKVNYSLTSSGEKLFAPFRPPKQKISVNHWIKLGHYIFHLQKLQENASEDLIRSEEIRIENIFYKTGLM